MLQQYLPFTVLKLDKSLFILMNCASIVATVLTVYGIETDRLIILSEANSCSCNSTYRLRY